MKLCDQLIVSRPGGILKPIDLRLEAKNVLTQYRSNFGIGENAE